MKTLSIPEKYRMLYVFLMILLISNNFFEFQLNINEFIIPILSLCIIAFLTATALSNKEGLDNSKIWHNYLINITILLSTFANLYEIILLIK